MEKSQNAKLDSFEQNSKKSFLLCLSDTLIASFPKATESPDFPTINDVSTSDITIKIEPNGPLIFAHRSILATNTFFAAFQNFKEWDTGVIKIESKYPKGIQLRVEYLYDLESRKPEPLPDSYFDNFSIGRSVCELLLAADYLQMNELVGEIFQRFPDCFESKVTSLFFVFTDLHLELFRKIMASCVDKKMQPISKLRVILTWTKGFTEDNAMLKTKDVFDLLNSSISVADRRSIKTSDLLKLVAEFTHFDYVVPFSFTKCMYLPICCSVCGKFCEIINGKPKCHLYAHDIIVQFGFGFGKF